MPDASACPEPQELQHLLGGSLSDERQQQCTDHLDSCGGCQAKLEQIAVAGSDLTEVVQQLHDSQPLATSAYWPALQSLESIDSHSTVAAPLAARPRGVSLNFLQPATDNAYLGRLAHFDVMRVLGRGAMGIVLEAFDSRLQRNVAIKVLDPELASDEVARQRFCREARAAASITHENVVAVHQVERAGDDGLPYLVMQLVSGEALDTRISREKRLPMGEIIRIGMQAAQGLAAAHAQGLIHRDIKPANILLEPPNDRVKLTDFGLARAAEDVRLTRTGFVTGTPLYMSPEQARGEAADPRSDLFSLGAILYEMCAGVPPFDSESVLTVLRQIAEVKHRPVREINPDVPEWLAGTIDRLLAKKPGDRIQTAAQLAELLDFELALMKTSSVDLPTVCQIEVRRRTLRNRWIGAALGGFFLVAGLLGGMWLSGRVGSTAAATSSVEPVALLAANSGAVWSVAFDPSGSTVAMAVEDGTVRLWDWPTKSVQATINAHRGNIWASRYSPGGELLATAGDDGLIKLWKPPGAEPVRVFEQRNAIRGLAWARDGQSLFAGDRAGSLRVWSLDAAKPLAEVEQPGAIYAVAISPDNETLATAGSDKIVRLWNAKTLTQKLPLEGHSGPVYGLSFRSDGRRLASAGWDKMVRIWNVASGQLVKSWAGHDGDIWVIAYSPDGTRLATGGTDGALKIWDAQSGELRSTYLDHNAGVRSLAFNQDGTLLASGGRDGAVRVWKVE